MANPHKGEVEFRAGEASYKISFSADALCELEGALGKNLDEIINMLQAGDKLRLADLRIMFWKGLEDHQPGKTFEDARAILKLLKPLEMGQLVGRAFLLSMPAAEEGEAAAVPPKAVPEDGTGAASSTNGVPSV
jgi:hypothetical protein